MNEFELKIMKGMVSILNEASEAYYNTGKPIMTDEQYDARLRDLMEFEKETGFVLANSPTQKVGAKVLTELQEITHNHPMLSLDKIHTVEELIRFANNKPLVSSIKLDGLTVSLKYKNGVLVSAETRGDGYVGSDITEHIKQFKNVPMKINDYRTYVIDGEAIITDEDFDEVNKDGEYANSRNLASGTLSVLDTSLVAKRRLKFFAWDVIEGGRDNLLLNLQHIKTLGFDVVPFWLVANLDPKKLEASIDFTFDYAEEEGLPCDGIVFKFNDIEYGKSLGATSHHFKNGVAYKRQDDVYETELVDIDWTMGKTGVLTPTAVFKPVEIDGTIVERASVHNISILTKLDLHVGDTIEVYKANQIIPQVKRNVSADKRMVLGKDTDYIIIPSHCPICGESTVIKRDNDSQVLVCTNDNCKGKLLGKLTHFVSKNAINIDGMSEATLEKFIELGYVNSFDDIYELKSRFYNELIKLDGFGKKSVDKLMDAIESSRNTTLDRFIYSLSIPLIGRSASKDIAKFCDNDINKFINTLQFHAESFLSLDGFGEAMFESLYKADVSWISNLSRLFTFEKTQKTNNSNVLSGLTFVITGSVEHFKNRDELKEKIESLGGKVSGSVSAKTNYLINNNITSTSGKNKKAIELNIPIINEEDFLKMIN